MESCVVKLAKGGHCQVLVQIDDLNKFLMDFDMNTTVSDVRRRLDDYARSKGASGPFPRWSLLYKGYKLNKQRLEGDNATLLDSGVDNEHAIPNQILVEGQMKGGVAYGEHVEPSKFDFVVLIFYQGENKGRRETMVGTGIIHGRHVLTAAHVLADRKPEDFHIMLATHHYSEVSYKVESIHFIDGTYDHAYASKDMAVAVLKGNGYFPNAKVHFAQTPLQRTFNAPPEVYLAGFGQTEKSSQPAPDRKLVVGKFKAFDKCQPRKPRAWVGCASSQSSPTAACNGDSGGPWFYTKGTDFWIFGLQHGSTLCQPGTENRYDTADITLLSATVDFWKKFFKPE